MSPDQPNKNMASASIKNKMMMVVGAFAVAVIGVLVLFILLLGNGGSEVTPILEDESADTGGAEPLDGVQLTEQPIAATLTTDEGVEISIRNIILPFVAEGDFGLITPVDSDKEFIALDILATNKGPFEIDLISSDDFHVEDGGGESFGNSFVIGEDEMWAIGFRPFVLDDFMPGDSSEGYILFEVPRDADKLSLTYTLQAFSLPENLRADGDPVDTIAIPLP